MTVQASWNNRNFEISNRMLKSLEGLNSTYKVKKKSNGDNGASVVEGHEIQKFNISYSVSPTIGIEPLNEYNTMASYLGKSAPFLLENTLFGPASVLLDGVSLSAEQLTNNGQILYGKITLSFTEWSPEGKMKAAKASAYVSPLKTTPIKPQAADDVLKIFYNGKDIKDSVSLSTCEHDMYADNKGNKLLMRFNDTRRLWDKWKPDGKDIIQIKYGLADTGRMFVEKVKPENGLMTLKADSIPDTFYKTKYSKSWQNVHLHQLYEEIAGRHGLTFEEYDVEDVLYSYVRQANIPDFDFITQRCKLEGLNFLVHDKKLVVFNEEQFEKRKASQTIVLNENNDFSYDENYEKGYGNSQISNGSITGTYVSPNGLDKPLIQTINCEISSQDEGNRYAKGLLGSENKNFNTGVFKTPLMRGLAAGSVVALDTKGAASWDGNVFINRLRQDYVSMESKVFFRKAVV